MRLSLARSIRWQRRGEVSGGTQLSSGANQWVSSARRMDARHAVGPRQLSHRKHAPWNALEQRPGITAVDEQRKIVHCDPGIWPLADDAVRAGRMVIVSAPASSLGVSPAAGTVPSSGNVIAPSPSTTYCPLSGAWPKTATLTRSRGPSS